MRGLRPGETGGVFTARRQEADETRCDASISEDYAAILVRSFFTSTWAKMTSGSR
jgi:hypothetical protein